MNIRSFLRDTLPYRWYKELKGKYAAYIYKYPSHDMVVIGVTGTDGKTTTCNLIYHIFQTVVWKTMFIWTTGVKINWKDLDWIMKMTSYDPLDLHKFLALWKENGCKYAVLEVSSHALEQHRFKNVEFSSAVLTNISHEHIDYHKTFDRYASAKQRLFRMLQQSSKEWVAVLPQDDTLGKKRAERMDFKTKITFWFNKWSTVRAVNIRLFPERTECTLEYHGNEYHASFPLLWRFNISNVLAALSVALWLWLTLQDSLNALQSFVQAPWRQEHYFLHDIHRYIDFAHTPMGLEVMLEYLQMIKGDWRVICLFGAPGMRDPSKRPFMWRVVERMADIMIVTDDDADKENRWEILWDIVRDIEKNEWDDFYIIPDRRDAIEFASSLAKPWDVVLLAWKWHEKVLVTNFWKIPRSDKELLFATLRESRNASES